MIFFFKKVSQCRKKNKKGDPLRLFNIHSVAEHRKNEGDPLGKICFRKNTMPKKSKMGEPFGLSWYCMLRGKTKHFWFSSLSQMFQFGTLKFRRIFKNYFGQFVWIEKREKVTIIVAFHSTKRRLKTVLATLIH